MQNFVMQHWPTFAFGALIVISVLLLVLRQRDSYMQQNVYFESKAETTGEYVADRNPHDGAPIHAAIPVRIYGENGSWTYKVYKGHRWEPLDDEYSNKLTTVLTRNPSLVKDDETITVPFEEIT